MYWAPPSLLKLEARAISRILKIPSYAFGVDGPFHLKKYGILSCRSILSMNMAAMFRASRVTLDGWQRSWGLLLDSLDHRDVTTSPLPSLSPPEWDSHSLASRLLLAYNGFRDNHLGCIPQHVLGKIQHAFHNYSF